MGKGSKNAHQGYKYASSEAIIEEARESLTRPRKPPSPGLSALFGDGSEAEREMYVTFGNGRIYLVTAHAKREELEGDAGERMR